MYMVNMHKIGTCHIHPRVINLTIKRNFSQTSCPLNTVQDERSMNSSAEVQLSTLHVLMVPL